MAYQEITSNKTVNLTSDASTVTLTYYAGNKNTSTGSFTGNATKHDIRTVIPSTISWITNAELSLKDDTAYNIKITYTANDTGSDRTATLKLSNSTPKESTYSITLSQAKKESTSVEYTITWNFTIINNSADIIPECTLFFELTNFGNRHIVNGNTSNSGVKSETVYPFNSGSCISNTYNNIKFDYEMTEGLYNITPHTFNVKLSLYTTEVNTTYSSCTFWSGGTIDIGNDFTLFISSSSYININNTLKTISISLQILDKQQ